MRAMMMSAAIDWHIDKKLLPFLPCRSRCRRIPQTAVFRDGILKAWYFSRGTTPAARGLLHSDKTYTPTLLTLLLHP